MPEAQSPVHTQTPRCATLRMYCTNVHSPAGNDHFSWTTLEVRLLSVSTIADVSVSAVLTRLEYEYSPRRFRSGMDKFGVNALCLSIGTMRIESCDDETRAAAIS
jgi:hypothetical protein